jgi:protease I
MATSPLSGVRVAILVTDGFEQIEMTEPKKALEAAGASVSLVAPKSGEVQGWKHHDTAETFTVDMTTDQLTAEAFEGVHLPGGVINGDALRIDKPAQEFLRVMDEANKPIAVICHGGWILISAGIAAGRKVTSWPSLQDDFENAGSEWVDEAVALDGNWVSSRKPADIPAYNEAMIRLFAQLHVTS